MCTRAGGGGRGDSLFATVASATAPATAAALLVCSAGRSGRRIGRVRIGRGFGRWRCSGKRFGIRRLGRILDRGRFGGDNGGEFRNWEHFALGRKGAAEPRNTFLGFGFPIAATKTLPGNGIPLHGIFRQVARFKMTRELKRHHRVTGFLKKIAELASRIFAALCAANTSCDLFPVGHRELCGGIVAVTGGKVPASERKKGRMRRKEKDRRKRVPVLAQHETVLDWKRSLTSAFTD